MLVRFKQAAEAVIDGIRQWVHPGFQGHIDPEHFHADVHESLEPPAAAPAPAAPSAPAGSPDAAAASAPAESAPAAAPDSPPTT